MVEIFQVNQVLWLRGQSGECRGKTEDGIEKILLEERFQGQDGAMVGIVELQPMWTGVMQWKKCGRSVEGREVVKKNIDEKRERQLGVERMNLQKREERRGREGKNLEKRRSEEVKK